MRSVTLTRRALARPAAGPPPRRLGRPRPGPGHHPAERSAVLPHRARPARTARGGPVVWGYVYLNSSGLGSARVRLLVETLDAAGQPIASEIAYVDTDVPFAGRTYF